MELQIKNVNFSERLSEETNAFAADVYFKGKKFAYAKNSGHGGCTDVRPYPNCIELYQEASEYAKSLPDTVTNYTLDKDTPFVISSNLEFVVDTLLEDWLEKKAIQKLSRKGIHFEAPDGTRYTQGWKGYSVTQLLASASGRAAIRRLVDKLEAEGNTILNTNLASLGAEYA